MDPAGYNGTAGSPVPGEQPQAGQTDGSSSFSVPAPPPPVMVDAGQGLAWGQPAETNGHGLLPLSTSSDAPLNLQDSAAGTSIDTTQFFSQAQGAPPAALGPALLSRRRFWRILRRLSPRRRRTRCRTMLEVSRLRWLLTQRSCRMEAAACRRCLRRRRTRRSRRSRQQRPSQRPRQTSL